MASFAGAGAVGYRRQEGEAILILREAEPCLQKGLVVAPRGKRPGHEAVNGEEWGFFKSCLGLDVRG